MIKNLELGKCHYYMNGFHCENLYIFSKYTENQYIIDEWRRNGKWNLHLKVEIIYQAKAEGRGL